MVDSENINNLPESSASFETSNEEAADDNSAMCSSRGKGKTTMRRRNSLTTKSTLLDDLRI